MFTLARIAGSASMIVLFALLSHMLAAAEYGTFRQIWLLNRNSLNIFAVGIGLSIYYFIPRIPVHERRPFAIQSGLILTALGMVLSAALVFGAEPIARLLNNAELAPLLRIFGLYPLLVLPTTLAESLLLSLERTGLLSLYYVVDRVGLVLVAAVAALWSGQLSVVFLALRCTVHSSFSDAPSCSAQYCATRPRGRRYGGCGSSSRSRCPAGSPTWRTSSTPKSTS
jgi:O-antigen/teichoic acid export membrane protein